MSSSSFPPLVGGTATYSFEICRGLIRQNFDVLVWTKSEVLQIGELPPGFQIYTVKDTIFTPSWLLRYRSELVGQKVIEKNRPNLLLVPRLDYFTRETLRWASSVEVPFAVILHGFESIETNSIVHQAKCIFCVSEAIAKNLPPSLQNKTIVVPNGVDTLRFSPGKPDQNVLKKYKLDIHSKGILNVGSWLAQKGQAFLLEAIAMLPPPPEGPELWLVGSGPEERKLRQAALRNKVYDRVKWLGSINDEDLVSVYRAAKFVVLSSFGQKLGELEGFGLPVLEAAACGIPAVVTNSGGLPEAVVHEKTGLVVEANNTKLLADAINYLWKNESLQFQYGLNAQNRVRENYTWDIVLQKLGREIRKAIQQSRLSEI
ncbi:MAG: glycosyltransferase family 4 protein [bacterium]|nr:glycosyltransferase family 4 protein [bacterium]